MSCLHAKMFSCNLKSSALSRTFRTEDCCQCSLKALMYDDGEKMWFLVSTGWRLRNDVISQCILHLSNSKYSYKTRAQIYFGFLYNCSIDFISFLLFLGNVSVCVQLAVYSLSLSVVSGPQHLVSQWCSPAPHLSSLPSHHWHHQVSIQLWVHVR